MQNRTNIDNNIYNTLGDRWYTAHDDPVALLRNEAKTTGPWVLEKIQKTFGTRKDIKILDVGSGAGFLSNRLAKENYSVHGIDMSEESLEVAKRHDTTCSVHYSKANAYELPYKDGEFDVVAAMDFLEHVDDPEKVVAEISRVLAPNGLFFFHTFNRNWLANLVIIKLVRLLVRNTPKHLHVIELFITPKELSTYCAKNKLLVEEMTGVSPKFSTVTIKSIFTRTVPEDFQFQLASSLKLSYLGYARKGLK